MECAVLDSAVDWIWESLLDFKQWCRNTSAASGAHGVFFYPSGNSDQPSLWRFTASLENLPTPLPKTLLIVYLTPPPSTFLSFLKDSRLSSIPTLLAFDGAALLHGDSPWFYHRGSALPGALLTAFRLYLPCLIGYHNTSQHGVPWVSGHLAQTLDGRIAASSGHSQWISNYADRKHAHRLRALHDAVLVGRSTVEKDNPRLTVREVQGKNPERVILDRQCHLLAKEKSYRIFREPGNNWLLHSENAAKIEAHPSLSQRVIPVAVKDRESASSSHLMDLESVLETIWSIGIRSVFVEGGGKTLSLFLAAERANLLHLHIAPILLGSGLPSFHLPPVNRIQEGTYFYMTHFYLDKEILLECIPRP